MRSIYRILFCSSLVILSACQTKRSLPPTIEEMESALHNYPSEDITKLQKVRDYLSKHKVYISLTTSPTRIKYLHHVFNSLNLEHVDKIILSIPKLYGRDQKPYAIPDHIKNYNKLIINQIEKDLGPITKLIPAIKYVLENSSDPKFASDNIIITVDDDTGYPRGMVNEIIKQMVDSDNTVVGASTQPLSFWDLPSDNWPDKMSSDVIEGFGGVGYKPRFVDYATMLEISKKMREQKSDMSCYLSDDMVISYVLALKGIRRHQIISPYYQLDMVMQYPYGFNEDALHRGGGDSELAKENLHNVNAKKYRKCFEFMVANYQ
jgi:outer membrane lipoprotein-sorting protein